MPDTIRHFEKVFVINLRFKQDRLATFLENVPKCLGDVTVWPAIHGDTVLHPHWWTAGNGAWGCYRSHLAILEHCYNLGIESYLVFEDDAIFRDNFEEPFDEFMSNVPGDWEQIYLGGQLLHEIAHPPKAYNDRCYVPYNVNRTHAFAVHKRGYEKLYQHLHAVPFGNTEHIDHHLGRLHESGRLRLFVPSKWLVGQDGGPSNVSGNINAPNFWADPEELSVASRPDRSIPAVFLEAPIPVALELSRRGWHRGYWVNEQHLDRGVCDAVHSIDCASKLREWYNIVRIEALRNHAKCVCLHHPQLTLELVESLPFADFLHVKADTADQSESLFADLMNRSAAA